MITDVNSEHRLAQHSFGDHLRDALGWGSIYAHSAETIGRRFMLWRAAERVAVHVLSLLYLMCVMNREIQL